MTTSSFRRGVGRLMAGCGLIFWVGAFGVVRAEAPSGGTTSADRVWRDACHQIVAGRIDTGARMIRQLTGDRVSHADLAQVQAWLADYEKLQAERDRFRQADHEHAIAQAKESVKKGEWLAVMGHLRGAYDSAKDPNAFLKEPDTTRLLKQAEAEGQRFYREGEWDKAGGIYYSLERIYKDEADYEQMRRRSLRHARLEIIYKKENAGKWQKNLRGIEPGMVRDAFLQVGKHYVRKADFRKALAGGIENLRILATTTELAKAFPQIENKDANVRFRGEITQLLNQIQKNDALTARQAYACFEDILKYNRRTLRLPESLVVSEFMDGALYPLDHFSSIVWPSDVPDFKKHTMGRFQGVGIQIRKPEGQDKLLVVTPLPETPAHHAGIRAGDVITHVDGQAITQELDIDDIVRMITGPKGTKVTLTIQRGTKAPFDVSIVRDVIIITSVRGYRRDEQGDWDYMIDSDQRIGYIRIDPSFTDGTVQEMKEALGKLSKQGAQALILDLRFNPGGLLRSAIDVTELFLPPDKVIVKTRGLRSEAWSKSSDSEAFFTKDMVVLVNEISASASEILAGALQDNQRAVILGTRTHGKGSVQNLIPLAEETAYLKLTTALYYLPSDRCPDKKPGAKVWGVPPDINVPLRSEEMIKIVQMRRDSDILGSAASQPSSRPATTRSATQAAAAGSQPAPMPIEDRPDIDPQAEAAMLVLRVKLLSGQQWTWSTRAASAPSGRTARVR